MSGGGGGGGMKAKFQIGASKKFTAYIRYSRGNGPQCQDE